MKDKPQASFDQIQQAARNFVPLDAPETLPPGESIYAQPPFDNVLSQIQQVFPEAPDSAIEYLLGHLAHSLHSLAAISDDFTTLQPSPNQYQIKPLVKAAKVHFRVVGTDIQEIPIPNVLSEIAVQLKEFPLWPDYLAKYQAGGGGPFGYDGHPMPNNKTLFETQSYAAYAQENIPQMARDFYIGLNEVVPDAYERTPHAPDGKGRQNRRWHILKSSELVKKK